MSRSLFVAPSARAASLRLLAEEMRGVGRAGHDWIRLDIVDRRGVPVSSFARAIRNATDKPINIHLMEVEPDRSTVAYPPNNGIMSGIYR